MQSTLSQQEIFSKRLRIARMTQGLTLRQLADCLGISHNMVHKYENSKAFPNSTILLLLSEKLKRPVDFFFRPFTVQLNNVDFRKKSSLSQKTITQIQQNAENYFERYLFLEESLGIGTNFKNPLLNITISNPSDIETAAQSTRNAWHLGTDAIFGVLEILERECFKIFLTDLDQRFDGLSGICGEIPFIVLNGMYQIDRLRFTALHEVGHLMLNFSSHFSEKDIEKLCHRFAGALLIPENVFRNEFGGKRNSIAISELVAIKEDYGISIAAIMARAKDLDLISDAYYKRFCITMNQYGYRKAEPGHYSGHEECNRFEQLLQRAAATEVLSLSMCASLAEKSLDEFSESLELIS